MRFIDLEDLDRSRQEVVTILNALQAAREEVIAEGDPERRRQLISRYQSRWTALRPYLSELSYNKCWYLECTNPGTDDDIDHFRPKLGVAEDHDHPGYYWLAFDWRNFRLSCHRANRPRTDPDTDVTGGKAAHFPLIGTSKRAFSPDDNIDLEYPGLLDPTDPTDPRFISFIASGEAVLSPEYRGSEEAEQRFEYSRLYLHLNWPRFVDDRTFLYNAILRNVERGEAEAPRPLTIGASAGLKNVIKDLRRLMAPSSPYSSAATIYIESFRHVWWVNDIVLRGPR
jgi:hypothetical protein